MKKIIFSLCLIVIYGIGHSQNTYFITGGTQLVSSSGANLVFGSGTITNNGVISYLSPSSINFQGAVNYGGTGIANAYNFNQDSYGAGSVFNSLFSVFNTATINTGNVNANNNVFIRSDNNTNANVVINGVVTNNIQGIIPTATVTNGTCPSYNSVITLNASGNVLNYQWQSSVNNTNWSDLSGAVNPTLNAVVTTTTYYRCHLTTSNSAFDEYTGSVKLNFNDNSTKATVTATSCASYFWHDSTYTQSTNTATFDSLNAAGCDSLTTLNLTIINKATPTVSLIASSYSTNHTPVTITANTTDAGTNPYYYFLVNNEVIQAGNSNVFSTDTLSANDSIRCILISSATCVVKNSAVSDTIVMRPLLGLNVYLSGNEENDAICNWQTTDEYNAVDYIIERSTNGVDFSDIATVPAIGNTGHTNYYQYTDLGVTDPKLYYRLKIVYKDSHIEYSAIDEILTIKRYTFDVYPRPTHSNVTIFNSRYKGDGNTYINIITVDGKILTSIKETAKAVNFNVSMLPVGEYLVQIVSPDGKATEKLLVE